MAPQHVLDQCALFVHGSTIATNTMLEGKGARVGLITTEGFRDALEIRRGLREDQFNHRKPYASVLVPRYLRRSVPGRIDADGAQHQPLDLSGLGDIVAVFETEGVEAVAVALMNSFLDDRHEQAVADALAKTWSGTWITTSAAVSPLMGEYERTSTAVVNAALSPRIVAYLRSLDSELADLGLPHPILLVQSNGGAASVSQLTERPVSLLLSGPAAAVGALNLYRQAVDRVGVAKGDEGNLISMEIGGTSCDVLLMSGGEVATRDDVMIAGYHVSTPAIDIHTVGAGGGTIAGVDGARMLYVGPEGAGADPGPACYGRGGIRPTVTDAQLVLGRLRPGKSAGGTLDLDVDAARQAIRTEVAEPLGLSIEDAAAGIIGVVEQHLLHAVEHISIERGHSPRRFTLVAAGGAGPMHGTAVAHGLGCRRMYVPRAAGALCAIGMLHADVRQDFVRFMMGSIDALPVADVNAGFAGLNEQAFDVLGREGFEPGDIQLQYELELHHPGQLWAIRVPVPRGQMDAVAVRAAFEAEYNRLYGHVQPNGTIMVASLRLTARGSTGEVVVSGGSHAADQPSPIEMRSVWHGAQGWQETPVYDGAEIRPGHRLLGPALVEELTTTVLVGPGDELWVDDDGNFFIDVDLTPTSDSKSELVATQDGDATRLDPIVLALMQNRLDQISRHMGWVMTRTARSTIFSQSHDFSCYITTPDGTLVANADGIPIHTGGGGFAVRALLGRFGGRMQPGDVFILSDPYVAGGNHLPDWVIGRPIWVEGADGEPVIAGFCCNRAHQSDIGGGLAGTYNPEATEIWHEGIRLPVMKLVDRGEIRDDVWEMLLINSRTPELLDGDLRAMLGSTQIGAERVTALVDELGLAPYLNYLDGVLEHADRRMRAAVAELPDGIYYGEDHSDNDCFQKMDIAIRVTLTVKGDEMVVDFSQSDPQILGFKNSSLANTYSSVYLAIASFFDNSIPRNEGTYRCVTIIAPEGSIVNARPPAPMTMNTVFVAHEIIHAVWRALAEADPSRACAGWSKTMHGHVTGRKDDGSTWVMYQWHAMGTPGATAERDGFVQMGHLVSLGGLDLPNLEFHEQMYPVRYIRQEQRIDNAGAGAHRGGTGVRYEADILVPATWSFRAEGLDTPSGYGVQGGLSGGVGYEWVVPMDEAADGPTFIPPKYGVQRLGPARMIADTPGGGGWGDPFTRDPQLVLRDVRDEVVSVAGAARDYGVVISADGRSVDLEATAALRANRRCDSRKPFGNPRWTQRRL
jgi:N-methylhydantoinase A/oxoprolinase/acetone carboxylase beta subunit/N-methylhydantoinase B/oxoprolinase/acetone carboxylase alpha subunit